MEEETKQKYRDEGIAIDDFLKVSELIEKLGLGKDLKKQFDGLLKPFNNEKEKN